MARTLEEIKKIIVEELNSSEVLSGLIDFSQSDTAIWKEWVHNIAYSHYVMEQMFDTHKTEISNKLIHQKKRHSIMVS